MMRSGRWSIAGPLVAGALVASACGGGSDTSASSSAVPSSTAPAASTPDDFTDVVDTDGVDGDGVDSGTASSESSPSSTSVAPGETVANGSDDADPDPDTSSTSTSPTAGGETPTNTNPSGSVADGPAQTSPSSASSTSTSTSTSTTAPARTTGESELDRALAAAFTAQLDADDEGFGEVFGTTCLGTEFVVAFGGAAAADADYTLNLTTVTIETNLFNDEPLSKPTADAVVAAFGRCGDFDDLLSLDLSGSAADDELSRCIVEAIPDGAQEAALSEDFQQIDGPALDAFDDAVDDAFEVCFG